MTNWISVKDRLPENESEVLVSLTMLFQEYKIAFFHTKDFYLNSHSDEPLTKWVTHWMPLPELPEGV